MSYDHMNFAVERCNLLNAAIAELNKQRHRMSVFDPLFDPMLAASTECMLGRDQYRNQIAVYAEPWFSNNVFAQ